MSNLMFGLLVVFSLAFSLFTEATAQEPPAVSNLIREETPRSLDEVKAALEPEIAPSTLPRTKVKATPTKPIEIEMRMP